MGSMISFTSPTNLDPGDIQSFHQDPLIRFLEQIKFLHYFTAKFVILSWCLQQFGYRNICTICRSLIIAGKLKVRSLILPCEFLSSSSSRIITSFFPPCYRIIGVRLHIYYYEYVLETVFVIIISITTLPRNFHVCRML